MLFLGSVLFRKNNRWHLSKETTKMAESMMWTVHYIHLPRKSQNHEINVDQSWGSGGVCPQSEFQNLQFRVLPCHCWYFSIVLALLSVAITVSTHLCVICCHFYCPVLLLLQGHVACQNFTLTRPQSCAPGSVSILENYPPTPLQLTQLTQHFAFSETLV